MATINFFALLLPLVLTGCGFSYYSKIAKHQVGILWHAEPIAKVLADPLIDPEIKRKLILIEEVKDFSEKNLGLKKSKNYSKFSKLKNRYVSYVVNASPAFEIKAFNWKYPIVGSLSYKGYPERSDAALEEQRLKVLGYDTYLRGVSAYSTLGWVNDPVLSSMLNYSDEQLVELIIHESTHEYLYIKSSASFNEQLASFFGRTGAELFYKERNSKKESYYKQMSADEKLFSEFVSSKKKELSKIYEQIRSSSDEIELKNKRKQIALGDMRSEFQKHIKPKLKRLSYASFDSDKLNNALLSLYSTYNENQDLFRQLYEQVDQVPEAFLKTLKTLEENDKPLVGLEAILTSKKR